MWRVNGRRLRHQRSQHRQQFEPVLNRLGDAGNFAQAVLSDPSGSLRRVGNTLIFGQPDGGERVIAFIEQTSPRIEAIENAVNGLQAGQAAISASLASLQAVSMISLGLTALTPVVLGVQFIALNRKFSALQKQSADLHKKFDAAMIADLRTALALLREGQEFLEAGERVDAHNRLTAALPSCIRSMKYFGELLGSELNAKKVNRDEVRLLARHLAVALVAVATCQIGLEKDQNAFAQSGHELDLLRNVTRWIFQETVARDPARYMLPALAESASPSTSWPASISRRETPGHWTRRSTARERPGSRNTATESSARGHPGPAGIPTPSGYSCKKRWRRSKKRTGWWDCRGLSSRCAAREGAYLRSWSSTHERLPNRTRSNRRT